MVGLEIGLEVDNETIPFRMMALSTKGYQNLMKMSTVKMMGKSNWEDVKHLTEGVAVIVPAPFASGDLPFGLDYFIGVFADTPVQEFSHPCAPSSYRSIFEAGDVEAMQMLAAIKDNQSLTETGPIDQTTVLKTPQDLKNDFAERFPQAITNLENLVQGIQYDIDTQLKLPRFNPQKPAVEELRELAQAGSPSKELD